MSLNTMTLVRGHLAGAALAALLEGRRDRQLKILNLSTNTLTKSPDLLVQRAVDVEVVGHHETTDGLLVDLQEVMVVLAEEVEAQSVVETALHTQVIFARILTNSCISIASM